MRLLLIRHGETTANAGRILDTAPPGHSLTDLGRRQAEGLVPRLDGLPVGAIYASDLVRTQQTAAPLAAQRGIEVQVHPDGREISGGALEGATHDEAFEQYAHTVFSWGDVRHRGTRLAGGESGHEVLDRFDRQLARAADAVTGLGDAAVVVAHGAIIRIWTSCRALGADASFIAGHPMPNTGIVELQGDPRQGWTLVTYDGLSAADIADGIDDARADELARDERQESFGG
ncbi:histidine phosphatase family protein [Cumulibacter manganitolerans]|uniref:histidine phosphatase family protein n=1 Tax=Cumulibacter manganitolerans TaxID=1884992 RepID=UPI001295229C|nr:histidine phosphatase family protein [Cumulibacter manganitolerans]